MDFTELIQNIDYAKNMNITLELNLLICRKEMKSQVNKIKSELALSNV